MSASFNPPLLYILPVCVYRLRVRGGFEGERVETGGGRIGKWGGGRGWVSQIMVAALFGSPYGHHTPRMEWRNEDWY